MPGAIQLDATAPGFHEIRRYDTYPTWQGSVAGILTRRAAFGIREEAATGRLVQIVVYYELPCNEGIDPATGEAYDPLCERITIERDPRTQEVASM
ncbi:MAG: hypothetical protein D6795_02505, partial [Deltaproteobacteria bacterium]